MMFGEAITSCWLTVFHLPGVPNTHNYFESDTASKYAPLHYALFPRPFALMLIPTMK